MLRPELLPAIKKIWAAKRPGIPLNLENPQTFSERIQWLKLFDENKGQRYWCDKLTARYRIKSLGLRHILVPLATKEDIPCVVKTNHQSGRVFVCYNQAEKLEAIEKLKPTLAKEYGVDKAEWGYLGIEPTIYCEKLLPENADYKFHCVNSKPVLIQLITNRQNGGRETFYNMQLNKVDLHITKSLNKGNDNLPYGGNEIAEMLPIVKRLAARWRYVRVDLYYSEGKVYFGELTFWPMAGFCLIGSDKKLGEIISWD